jgi:hypothetical protein
LIFQKNIFLTKKQFFALLLVLLYSLKSHFLDGFGFYITN